MSLLPLLTNREPGAPLYAPAGSGGGGGGVGPDLTLSTLTLAGSSDLSPSILTSAGGQININADNGVIFGSIPPNLNNCVIINGGTGSITCEDAASNNVLILTTDGSSGKGIITQGFGGAGIALENISSINGAPPGGGGAAVSTFSDLTVSNPIASGATLNMRASDTDLYEITTVSSSVALAGMSVGLVGGRNQVYMATAEAPNFYTSTIKGSTGQISLNPNGNDQIVLGGAGAPGDISVLTVGGGRFNVLAGSISTVTNDVGINGGSYANLRLAATGATNALNVRADNAANATIWAEGVSGLTLSTVTSMNSGTPATFNPTPSGSKYSMQSGYCQDWPQASTVLFAVPYDTENITVMITPTNRNISGGANPNMSLLTSYGVSGTGVSSIGFAVDPRNGGVGYDGSFMWLALPRNT